MSFSFVVFKDEHQQTTPGVWTFGLPRRSSDVQPELPSTDRIPVISPVVENLRVVAGFMGGTCSRLGNVQNVLKTWMDV